MYMVIGILSDKYIVAKIDESLDNKNIPLTIVDKNKLEKELKNKSIENYDYENGKIHYNQGSEKSLLINDNLQTIVRYFLLSKETYDDNSDNDMFRVLAFDGVNAIIKVLPLSSLISIYNNKMLVNAHIVNSVGVKPFVKLNAGILKENKHKSENKIVKNIADNDTMLPLQLDAKSEKLYSKFSEKPVNDLVDMTGQDNYSSKEKDFLKKHKFKRFGSYAKKALVLGAVCVALGGTLGCSNAKTTTPKNTISSEVYKNSQQIVFDYTNNTVKVGKDEYKMKKINGSTYFEDKDGNLLSEIQDTQFHDIKNHQNYKLDETIKDGYKYTTAIDESTNEVFSIRQKLSDIKDSEVDGKVSIEIKDKSGNYVPAFMETKLMETKNVSYYNPSDYSFANLYQRSGIFRVLFIALITYVVLDIRDVVRDERKKKKLNGLESDIN